MAGSGGFFPFERLTRKHGVKVITEGFVSLEKCVLAIGKVVGCENIKSASRMHGSVVAFLSQTDLVHKIVESGIVINDLFVAVSPLEVPAKKIILSNVPPFLKNELIMNELSRHGQIVSAPKRIPLGCKSPLLKHVVSFRRQLFMLLNKPNEELNIVLKFKIEGSNYVIFATSDTMKCFNCGVDGHLVKNCPKTKEQEGDGERAERDVSVTREATVPSSAGGETEKKNVEINDRGVAEPSEAVGAGVIQNNVTSVVPETKSKEPSSVVGGGEHQNADRENARGELKERKAAGSSDGAAAGENQKSTKAVQLDVESIKDVVAGTSKVKETEAGKTEGESPSQCTSNKDENLRKDCVGASF